MTQIRKNGQGISLFPMFNILVCTLGVLIFILSTVATVSLGPGKSVVIIPGDHLDEGKHKRPTYVEWNGADLILHPSGLQITFRTNLEDIGTYRDTYAYMDEAMRGTEFQTFFEGVHTNRGNEYIIVLLRPSGFDSFGKVKGYITQLGIDIGYEPVDQEWQRIIVR